MSVLRNTFTLALLLVGTGLGAAQAPADKDKKGPAGKNADVPLVERLLAARKEYQLTLEALRKHYIQVGDIERARLAEDELLQYHRITKQVFNLILDMPPPTLKGNNNIPEANRLLRQALQYKDKGWGTAYIDNQRRAELLLQKLLTEYPQSNRISEAAFLLGDLYESRAFRQLERAAGYYERCFQWKKDTQHDARIRAARLYDHQLNQKDKAISIYKEITTHEHNDRVIEEAKLRLTELSNRR